MLKILTLISVCIALVFSGNSSPSTKLTTSTSTTKLTTTTTTSVPTTSQASVQSKFNSALDNYYKKINGTKIPRNKTKSDKTHSQSNMRITSDSAKITDDLFQFILTFSANNSINNTFASLFINQTFCPYLNQPIVCNFSSIYRTYDGTCNNKNNPILGRSNTPFTRLLPPAYQDGFNSPRSLSVTGSPLPNPRNISLTISAPSSVQKLSNYGMNQMYAQFGQFLTHDLMGTSTTIDSLGNEFYCPCDSNSTNCISFKVPYPDPYLGLFCNNTGATTGGQTNPTCFTNKISNQTCMQQTRSSATFPTLNCSTSYREQLNLLSAYIDGSPIYGMDSTIAASLRTFSGGLLKTSPGLTGRSPLVPSNLNESLTGRTYLPIDANNTCSSCSLNNTTPCASSSPIYNCFLAGEYRTSENLGLVSMHTLFNREHNRIAAALAKVNPTWTDEILYQETRRIVIAQLQHITYNEFIPQLVGNISLMPLNTNAYFTGYNPNVSPQITGEFSTAAFRMGHSLIRQIIGRSNINQNYTNNSAQNQFFPSYNFYNSVFQSDMAYNNNTQGLNGIFLGILNNVAWKFGTFGTSLQNNLFQVTYPNGTNSIDLLAYNINRGRDHGLQPYVNYIKKCFNVTINSFADLSPTWMNSFNMNQLKSLYSNVNDIDLYAGGLSEAIVGNWTIGPTFGCIIMQQFANIKVADRFWYENGPSTSSTAFTLNQLQQIKNVTLAGLICNNYDVFTIPKQAFYVSSNNNPALSCQSLLGQINFSKWAI